MKIAPFPLALVAVLLAANALPAQEEELDLGTYGSVEKEHEWLKQFEGQWVTEAEASFGPDQPAIKCTGTMKSRPLGQFWMVNEMETNMQGATMTGIQSIGYDPRQKKYVGTWVDSMMNHLWKYEGTVDETGKKLILEAEGPNMMQEGAMTQYRDAYEFKSPDHIVATSSILVDGNWVTFMTGNYKRKK